MGSLSLGLLICKMGLIIPACLSQWLWMKGNASLDRKALKSLKVIEASVLTLPRGKESILPIEWRSKELLALLSQRIHS